jgi:hypothetical protein
VIKAAHGVEDREQAVRRHRLGLALGLDRLGRLRLHGVTDQGVRRRAQQDLTRAGGLLEAGGGIHRVPRREGTPGSGGAGDHRAGVDACANRELDADLGQQSIGQLGHGGVELVGSPDRSQCVVLAHLRKPEDREDRVADELLDRAAVPFDRGARHREVTAHHAAVGLGVQLLAHRGRAGDVGEQKGDGAPRLALGGGRQGRAALQAELGGSRQFRPALGAREASGRRTSPHAGILGVGIARFGGCACRPVDCAVATPAAPDSSGADPDEEKPGSVRQRSRHHLPVAHRPPGTTNE